MSIRHLVTKSGTGAVCAAIVLMGSVAGILRAHADGDDRDANEAKIRIGFEIAPVPLNAVRTGWQSLLQGQPAEGYQPRHLPRGR